MLIKKYFSICLFSVLLFIISSLVQGNTLIWQDEFDGALLDETKWTRQDKSGVDTGNNQKEYNTTRVDNSYLEDGFLVIKAMKEEYSGYHYTSARIRTKGKGDFLYGKIEARIQIPTGNGTWPAFWMMPTDSVYGGWAASGEIDIMESVNEAAETYGTPHYGGAYPNNDSTGGSHYTDGDTNFADDFHIYGIEWEENEIRWYCDGNLFKTVTSWWSSGASYPAPFDQNFYIILNLAIGGNWPDSDYDSSGNTTTPLDSEPFPKYMKIDWVRVYSLDDTTPTPTPSPTLIPVPLTIRSWYLY